MSEATLAQIAQALGVVKRTVELRARKEAWEHDDAAKVGRARCYSLDALPDDVRAALLKTFGSDFLQDHEPANEPGHYDPEALQSWAASRPQRLRDVGAERAALLAEVMSLHEHGLALDAAFSEIACQNDVSAASLKNWYYGANGKHGAKDFDRRDWAAALTPRFAGRTRTAHIPEAAWDWFKAQWLQRSQPTIKETYRRLQEVAKHHGWKLPSERTFVRRVETDIAESTKILFRLGPEALGRAYPKQRRDKLMFAAGEAVTGDGLKFDWLRVLFPDGEIVDKTTGWFWADIRTGRILAYHLDKTENTDMFRLATHRLLNVCSPSHAWLDNTVVAANKAMTGRSAGRHRHHDNPDDPPGLLLQMGMEVHFTNPDKVLGSPGAKPIERAFGIGGLHEMVRTSPRLRGKGYNKGNPIPFALFAAIVEEEVKRYNARPGRRTQACRGVLSFDEAWIEGFTGAAATKLPKAQRDLLLLMPEVVTCDRERGEVRLKAGNGPFGKPRYWKEPLTAYKGQKVIAYYDPEDLEADISVCDMDGRFIVRATHIPNTGFKDVGRGREHNKEKQRKIKAQKIAARAENRMSLLESEQLYPQFESDEPPPATAVKPEFSQKARLVNGKPVSVPDEGQKRKREATTDSFLAQLHNRKQEQL